MKYLGINLRKRMQDTFTENYKTLLKEIKDDLNRELYHIHDEKTQ